MCEHHPAPFHTSLTGSSSQILVLRSPAALISAPPPPPLKPPNTRPTSSLVSILVYRFDPRLLYGHAGLVAHMQGDHRATPPRPAPPRPALTPQANERSRPPPSPGIAYFCTHTLTLTREHPAPPILPARSPVLQPRTQGANDIDTGEAKFLCFRGVTALPFNKSKYVDGPVCACCCLQCMPNAGCAKPPPSATTADGGQPCTAGTMGR